MNLRKTALLGLCTILVTGNVFAQEGPVPKGVPRLDHVFVIMMENHGYSQLINNPNAPFINELANYANTSTNYFAVAHPSLTNYLEVVGGSNFGVLADDSPDWHNPNCTPSILAGTAVTESSPSGTLVCPVYGTGTDAATPRIDYTNETQGPPGTINIDGTKSLAADAHIVGKTIADQLAKAGYSWKSYQESLPFEGADGVNTSDGFFTDSTDFTNFFPALTSPLSQSDLVALYAVKHDPFAYFRDIQEGVDPKSSLKNIVGFEGTHGLYGDLASGRVPMFSFIAPNQCDDQHGRGNAGAFCNYDPNDNGTQVGLNPALLQRGDITVHRLVRSIKESKTWRDGKNAIIILWDENDYSVAPVKNQVLFIVDTSYGVHGVKSETFYDHFSLLKTLDAAFNLPCLNHACDAGVSVMSDLFEMDYRPQDHFNAEESE